MSIIEILSIVMAIAVAVVILNIGLKRIKRVFNQRKINDLEKQKQIPVHEITLHCKMLLLIAAVFNIISFMAMFVLHNKGLVYICGITAFIASFMTIIIMRKNNILKGKGFAIFNLILALFLTLFYPMIGVLILLFIVISPPAFYFT
ncbi:MAG: hypothetical protein CO042_00470 [Parcubacteria group bacterium CG_4_9_14_0_2_um_filter_41_8]|nr:MAG: hypothetical protein CO042_00470 [Parcubacteria group bacterium CG_4_9_14_0_2_um_filter_41_8]